jgi:hypothetical protein
MGAARVHDIFLAVPGSRDNGSRAPAVKRPASRFRRAGLSSGRAALTRPVQPHSAAMRTWGWASRTEASTCFSKRAKFSWNMATRRRAVASKSALSAQVLDG